MTSGINLVNNIHEFIKNRRKSIGYTIYEVAERIDCSICSYNRFEMGHHTLNSKTFLQLCCLLCISFDDLVLKIGTCGELPWDDTISYMKTLSVLSKILRDSAEFLHIDRRWYEYFFFILEHDFYIKYKHSLLGNKYIKTFTGLSSPTLIMFMTDFHRNKFIKILNHTSRRKKYKKYIPSEKKNIQKPEKPISDFIEQYTQWCFTSSIEQLENIVNHTEAFLLTHISHPIDFKTRCQYASQPILNKLQQCIKIKK